MGSVAAVLMTVEAGKTDIALMSSVDAVVVTVEASEADDALVDSVRAVAVVVDAEKAGSGGEGRYLRVRCGGAGSGDVAGGSLDEGGRRRLLCGGEGGGEAERFDRWTVDVWGGIVDRKTDKASDTFVGSAEVAASTSDDVCAERVVIAVIAANISDDVYVGYEVIVVVAASRVEGA